MNHAFSTLMVHTSTHDYPIHIGQDTLSQISELIPHDTSRLFIVSNPTVFTQYGYGEVLVDALAKRHQTAVITHLIPDGEAYKSMDTLNEVLSSMLQYSLDRKSVLIALGGGVVGDLAGFAAACYMRGIRFIQVPTTILSQVDSSVGGKTAVNHPLGKNMIGAFYQPIAVHIDTKVLKTLPKREISAGLAEVIKYGLIMDEEFFQWCEQNVQRLLDLEPEALLYAIKKSCECKASIVGQDEKETGQKRALLNLGHTFAHAIEAGLGFGTWLHGEAVACGMIQAAELSHDILGLPRSDVERIRQLVKTLGCPSEAPNLGEAWFDHMRHDKKNIGTGIRYILLERIGHAIVKTVDDAPVKAVIERITME